MVARAMVDRRGVCHCSRNSRVSCSWLPLASSCFWSAFLPCRRVPHHGLTLLPITSIMLNFHRPKKMAREPESSGRGKKFDSSTSAVRGYRCYCRDHRPRCYAMPELTTAHAQSKG